MNNTCPECGNELIAFKEGSSVGVRCPKCDYSIVTTFSDPVYEDDENYSVILDEGNTCSEVNIRIISKLTGKNFLEARELIKKAPVTMFAGKAYELSGIKQILAQGDIHYRIETEYPY